MRPNYIRLRLQSDDFIHAGVEGILGVRMLERGLSFADLRQRLVALGRRPADADTIEAHLRKFGEQRLRFDEPPMTEDHFFAVWNTDLGDEGNS